jgi:hypothetical protein
MTRGSSVSMDGHGEPGSSATPTARASENPVASPVRAVFDALQRAGVRWCLLRGETDLSPTAHDLDLLVAPEDVPTLAAAVRPLGLVRVPTFAGGSHRFFVSYLRALDRWLILDVVTELSYGPGYSVGTRAAASCLARRQATGSLVVPAPDDAFWALLLHRLLDRGSFRTRDQERLQRLVGAARTDGPLARFAAAICPAGWNPAAIVAAVSRGDWRSLSELGARLLAGWRREHPAQFVVGRLVAPVARRLGPRLSGRAVPGLRVALVADEADTAAELAAALADSFHLPVTRLQGAERPLMAGPARPVVWRFPASAAQYVVARLRQLRGRMVILPLAAPASASIEVAERAAASGFRAQLVFDLRRADANGSAPRRGKKTAHEQRYLGLRGTTIKRIERTAARDGDSETLAAVRRKLTAELWQAYCERRG